MSHYIVSFPFRLSLTITKAYLATCTPTSNVRAEIHLVTTHPHNRVEYVRLGCTTTYICSNTPTMGDSFQFILPPPTTNSTSVAVVVRFVDGKDRFCGETRLPWTLADAPLSAPNVRRMLSPRGSDSSTGLVEADMDELITAHVDDFGWVDCSWTLAHQPLGGVLSPLTSVTPRELSGSVGCVVRAMWMSSAASRLGSRVAMFVDVGMGAPVDMLPREQFIATFARTPRFLRFHCATSATATATESEVATVDVPVPPATDAFVHRNVFWCAPVQRGGEDWGVVSVCLRLLPEPFLEPTEGCTAEQCTAVNDAMHQMKFRHPIVEGGRPLPDTPMGALRAVQWEGASHIARATERRWKRSAIVEASPQPAHLHLLLEAARGSAGLDPSLTKLAEAFACTSDGNITRDDVQRLAVAVAFLILECREALHVAFSLRAVSVKGGGVGISVADCVWILDASLAPKTLDAPMGELSRSVGELMGVPINAMITFEQYDDFLVRNPSFWIEWGIEVERVGISQRREALLSRGRSGGPVEWITFTVQSAKNGKSCKVHTSVADTISDCAHMCEALVGIPADRQEWNVGTGKSPLSASAIVGTVVNDGSTVMISEAERTFRLKLVQREKARKWDMSIAASSRVLQLRAAVNRKTLIPLSRLMLAYAGSAMHDRYSLEHYGLADGAVVEVSET